MHFLYFLVSSPSINVFHSVQDGKTKQTTAKIDIWVYMTDQIWHYLTILNIMSKDQIFPLGTSTARSLGPTAGGVRWTQTCLTRVVTGWLGDWVVFPGLSRVPPRLRHHASSASKTHATLWGELVRVRVMKSVGLEGCWISKFSNAAGTQLISTSKTFFDIVWKAKASGGEGGHIIPKGLPFPTFPSTCNFSHGKHWRKSAACATGSLELHQQAAGGLQASLMRWSRCSQNCLPGFSARSYKALVVCSGGRCVKEVVYPYPYHRTKHGSAWRSTLHPKEQ